MILSHALYGSDGPPVLIIHGLFGSGRNWTSIARALSEYSHRVYCLDLPNHGQSPWSTEALDYPAIADCIKDWIEQQNLRSVILLGHSMGGKAAMTLALLYPEYVSKIMVVDIAPVTYTSMEHLHLIHTLQSVDLSQFTRRQEVENILSESIPDEGLRKFLTHNIVSDQQNSQLRWAVNLQGLADSMEHIRSFPTFDSAVSFKNPSFFLVGGRSSYIKNTDYQTIQTLFPGHRFACMEECGHWPHAENPKVFTQHAATFLTE